ncbi:MAG: hypothetical protein OEY91_06460 [Nitrospirota bacterium]|nr:hypothetical protein [Nitrospirota bacterium]
MESLILFFVFLFLSAIALGIRWLHEKIRREIALKDLKDLFLPSDDALEQPDRVTPATTRISLSKPQPPIHTFRPTITPKRLTASRLRLCHRADLRQGIIIMTVLGPCRALEHPDH